MNNRNSASKEQSNPSVSPRPVTVKLANLTNQPQPAQLQSLKHRIDQLESKISQLQSKIKTKHKRIRRKSSEVQKKHKCEYCNKMYGTLVSLNLHLRIKHKQERKETKSIKKEEDRGANESSEKAQ